MSSEKKMLTIGICDDEEFMHKEISSLLTVYKDLRNIELEEVHFYYASDLIGYSDNVDILLLDIVMPVIDGIEAGFKLREEGRDYRIIMITNMKERASDSLKIGAFRFVEKPLGDGKNLFEAIDDALVTFLGYEKIVVKYQNTNSFIFQYQINYIKSMGNYVKIYTDNKVYEKNTSVKSLLSELDERLFIKTDKSYIVNLSSVKEVGKSKCILNSGEEIPISRRAHKDFFEAFSIFDAKGYNGIRNGRFY